MLEGLVMGESVGWLVEEIADYQEKTLFCDNTAAVALATSKGGSWRTRHLKIRAAHLRYKTETEEWKVRHLAGLDIVADIGTKALRGDRIAYLNELIKVIPAPRTAEVSAQALVDSEEAEQGHTNYLRAVTAVPTTYQTWFQQDLEKVAKLVALIELFQKIQTADGVGDRGWQELLGHAVGGDLEHESRACLWRSRPGRSPWRSTTSTRTSWRRDFECDGSEEALAVLTAKFVVIVFLRLAEDLRPLVDALEESQRR